MNYAYLCGDCRHLLSRHGLAEDGDLPNGPYRCMDCACAVTQDGPAIPLTQWQYKAWAKEHPHEVWKR